MQLTIAIIKPNLIEKGLENQILKDILDTDISIDFLKRTNLTVRQAQEFYQEHQGKPFYDELVNFMSSGDCIIMILTGDNVVKQWRDLIGETHPKDRKNGCMRQKYGDKENAMLNGFHGSDSLQSAMREYHLLKHWQVN